MTSTRAGKDFSALVARRLAALHALFDGDVLKAITPEAAVAARRTPQSTNPEAVAAAPWPTCVPAAGDNQKLISK